MTMDRPQPRRIWCVFLFIYLLSTGCSQYIDPNVPEPIRPYVEPEHGGTYLLYRPSAYDREKSWPLIVACHSSFPDTSNKRIRAWTQYAESYGFLVAVPELKGVKGGFAVKPGKQIARQRDDERHILAMIRQIRAGHNVSEDRIFIHGFSGGAYAALYTGLRHPEIFRALALSQPKCNEGYLGDVAAGIDRHQPVLVNYSVIDAITGKHARHCLDWLRTQGGNVLEDTHGAVLAADTKRPIAFFEEVLRKQPWIRIRAFRAAGRDPLQIQFKMQCSYQPTHFRWEFGDGEESAVAEPVHAFTSPGTYQVTVAVDGPTDGRHSRSVAITVPEALLGKAEPAPQTNR